MINLRDGRVVKIKEEIKQINTNRKQIEKQEMMDRFDITEKETENIFEDIDHHIEYLSNRHGLKFDLENGIMNYAWGIKGYTDKVKSYQSRTNNFLNNTYFEKKQVTCMTPTKAPGMAWDACLPYKIHVPNKVFVPMLCLCIILTVAVNNI